MHSNKLFVISAFVIALAGCSGDLGGGGGGGGYYVPSNSELTSLITNAVDRNVAHPYGYDASGWKEKDPSARPGWYVMGMSMNSSYYGSYFPNSSTYSHIAINTDEWIRAANARNMSLTRFVDEYFAGNIYLSSSESYNMYRGVSYYGSGYYIDDFGNMYDEAGATQKDLETLDALESEASVRETGKKLAAEFSLSEEQGFRVARVATEWQAIAKSRQMTAKDIEAFTKDTLGVDLSSIRSAAQKAGEGDLSSMENLINKAADNLDTTPENMKAIMSTLMN